MTLSILGLFKRLGIIALCRYAECLVKIVVMLNAITLYVVLLSVILMSVIMLSVVAP
jgi:hypothetical protein